MLALADALDEGAALRLPVHDLLPVLVHLQLDDLHLQREGQKLCRSSFDESQLDIFSLKVWPEQSLGFPQVGPSIEPDMVSL